MTRYVLALGITITLALVPAVASGQQTIESGMTRAEVISRLGSPATVREQGAWTYMFYLNNCPRRCGSDDVVFLEDGRVVAAVFRTGARRFRGPAADRAIAESHGPGAHRTRPRHEEDESRRLLGEPVSEESEVRGIRLRAPDDD